MTSMPSPRTPADATDLVIDLVADLVADGGRSAVPAPVFSRTSRVPDIVRRDPEATGPGVAMLQAALMGA